MNSFSPVLAQSQCGLMLRTWSANALAVVRGDELLVEIPVVPEFVGDCPTQAAKMFLQMMEPAPALELVDELSPRGASASYYSGHDLVRVYRREHGDDHEVGRSIVHEILHASGVPRRLARRFWDGCDCEAITSMTPADVDENLAALPPFEGWPVLARQEEFSVTIATSILCAQVGIMPYSTRFALATFDMARTLPKDSLEQAIRDAQAAVAYVLKQ
jgi:hypothetical protein